jgi:hypothetical protein
MKELKGWPFETLGDPGAIPCGEGEGPGPGFPC